MPQNYDLKHVVEAAKRGAVSIGVGEKRPGEGERIIYGVPVKKDVPEKDDLNKITGQWTGVVQTGNIKALSNTDKLRPARPGCSIGHVDITAGTFGLVARRNGIPMILSNNHVLANSNDAEIGDIILQPGPYDGGTLDDQIGTLHQFEPIRFMDEESTCKFSRGVAATGNKVWEKAGKKSRFKVIAHTTVEDSVFNLVDCALCMPFNSEDIIPDIIDIGVPTGEIRGELGMFARKSGRTTGYTEDKIIQVDVTAIPQYGSKVAIFTDQLMAGPMSAGGDSGSAVLNEDNKVFGLLFAGSESTTIINRWEHVEGALNVTL